MMILGMIHMWLRWLKKWDMDLSLRILNMVSHLKEHLDI